MVSIQDQIIEAELQEQEKRKKAKKRIVTLGVICCLVVLARLVFKDPPKYVAVDHGPVSADKIKYVPGMLAALPEEERSKLSPQMLAKFQEADTKATTGGQAFDDAWVRKTYSPQDQLPEIREDVEAYQEQLYQYAKRQEAIEEKRKELDKEFEIDRSKTQLVLLKRGGHIKAEKAHRINGFTRIKIHKGLRLNYPTRLIKSINQEAILWKEPVPKGFVRIKPARGITMVVAKKTAKHIRLRKRKVDET